MTDMDDLKRDLPTADQLYAATERIRYRKSYFKMLYSTISSLIVVAAVAVLISMLFLPVFRVTGVSMTPTMNNNDLLICNKWANFESGDIVAFYFNNKVLLKRVIGTAGDIVDIGEDGTVFVNGKALDEPYVSEKAFGECDIDLPYQVPDNRIFVMGDHRSVSVDSRSSSVGCIADEYVIGKVIFRIFPWEAIGPVQNGSAE